MSKPVEAPARRIEVFTGSGRRRKWSAEDKAAIVAESYLGGDTVSGIGRRHGLTASQLFAWRRAAGKRQASREGPPPRFVPAVVDESCGTQAPERRAGGQAISPVGAVEIEMGGVVVRIGPCAEAMTITAVIRALKACS